MLPYIISNSKHWYGLTCKTVSNRSCTNIEIEMLPIIYNFAKFQIWAKYPLITGFYVTCTRFRVCIILINTLI